MREGKSAEKKPQAGGLAMHIPETTADEDIEIIEVDEGDLAAVLSDEPFMTRFTYKLSAAIDKLKDQLFSKKDEAPPAKLPPQFFKPPKPGLVTKATLVTPGAKPEAKPRAPGDRVPGKPKAQITPYKGVPRRVRVIRRVKKPVRVSLISAEELASLNIDVGKRKWTFAVVTFVFAAIIGAGYYLITMRMEESHMRLSDVHQQLEETRTIIIEQQDTWSQYEDLQDRLTVLDDVLNEHVVISRMFDFLELRTLPSVAYRTAAWSTDGDLILDVIANSYDSAARQLIAFERSDTVVKVEATSFTAQTTGGEDGVQTTEVNFQLIVELDMDSLRGPLLVQEYGDGESEEEGEMETATTSTAMAN